MRIALVVAAIVAFSVQGSAPATIRVGLAKPGGGFTIVEMPIETYVARVVAGEAARDSRAAALEALAITVRTFAAANLGRHRADGFDLCDQTHCQVLRPATAGTERAAEATAGRLLLHDGLAATVYYSASCGGRTAIPSDVWPGHEDPPYLPSRSDDACGGAPEWTSALRASDLARALRASGFHGGALRDMRVASRNESGRVARLRLDGLDPPSVSGQDLRVAVGRTLGWQHIKSAAFDLRRSGDVYHFSGHGSGHGVGLCVIGSANLAEQGRTAEQILARYFPGLDVSAGSARASTSARDAPPGRSTRGRSASAAPAIPAPRIDEAIAVSLPDEDEGERATIVRESLAARDALARALGVAPPARLTLRFHPTTDDYERATGRAWFTAGAFVNAAPAAARDAARTRRRRADDSPRDRAPDGRWCARGPARLGEGRRGAVLRRRAGAARRAARAFAVRVRHAARLSDRQRGAEPGVRRRARERLRARPRVFREAD